MSRNFDVFSVLGSMSLLEPGASYSGYVDIEKQPGMAAFQVKMVAGGTFWISNIGVTLPLDAGLGASAYMMAVNEIQSFNLSGGLRLHATGSTVAYCTLIGKTAGT